MFSGIVEEAVIVKAIEQDKGNIHLSLGCSFVDEQKIDIVGKYISKMIRIDGTDLRINLKAHISDNCFKKK